MTFFKNRKILTSCLPWLSFQPNLVLSNSLSLQIFHFCAVINQILTYLPLVVLLFLLVAIGCAFILCHDPIDKVVIVPRLKALAPDEFIWVWAIVVLLSRVSKAEWPTLVSHQVSFIVWKKQSLSHCIDKGSSKESNKVKLWVNFWQPVLNFLLLASFLETKPRTELCRFWTCSQSNWVLLLDKEKLW